MSSSSITPPPPKVPKLQRWHRLILSLCLVAFAAELGLCLIVLPWLSNWDMSYIPVHSKRFSDLWMSPYFRGALTGLGLLDLYVALAESGKILRGWFAKSA